MEEGVKINSIVDKVKAGRTLRNNEESKGNYVKIEKKMKYFGKFKRNIMHLIYESILNWFIALVSFIFMKSNYLNIT